MKPYPKYKDSRVEWIGEVPEGWEILPIRALCHLGRGRVISNEEIAQNSGKYPVYSSQTANNGEMGRINSYDFDGEYVTWTTDGANAGTVFYRYGKFNCTNVCGTLKSKNKLCMPLLPYILNLGTKYYVRYDINPKLMNNMMAKIKISVPPYLEQTDIVAYLDHKTIQIGNLISKKQKLVELLKEERAATINQAVTKGLNPDAPMKDSGIEWLGEVPEHWEVKRLKWLTKGKLKYGANEATELADESLPRYIRITDFDDDGTLRIETFKSLPFEIAKDYLLHDGDILFARSGATVGKTFLYKNYKGIACYAGYLIKASVNNELILSKFLYYYTKSSTYEHWKDSVFIQATIQNIGADKYQMLNVPQPPMNEQVRIVKHIDKETTKIDQTIFKINKQIDLLKEYRTALISEVVTGKIDVRT